MAARNKFRSLQYTLDLDSMDIQDILSQNTGLRRATRSHSTSQSQTQKYSSPCADLSTHSQRDRDPGATSLSPSSPAYSPGPTSPTARDSDRPCSDSKVSPVCSASSQCDLELPSANDLSASGNLHLPDASKLLFLSHFEYNDSKDKTDPLIAPSLRGDTGAISDALNKMYTLLYASQNKFDAYIQFNDTRVSQIGDKVISLSDRVDKLGCSVNSQITALKSLDDSKASSCDFEALKSDFVQFKSSCDLALEQAKKVYSEQQRVLNLQRQQIANANLDIKRLNNDYMRLAERMNVSEIKLQTMNIFVEGLPESQDLSTVENLINRFNSDAETDLSENDFLSIHRVGKFKKKARYPRQIKIKMASEKARDKILACRGKLQPNSDRSFVWINEDHPDAYRRRKSMLRDLVKHINSQKGHRASIEAGGIRVDGRLYNHDQFNELPPDCHPRCVQVINTKHGTTLFAGEWAFPSNMFPCSVIYENTKFTSTEQCFQFCKARSHNELAKAQRIIINNDPFVCKQIGDSISDNDKWLECRERTLFDINKLKYTQNPELLDLLIDTGNNILQEATTGPDWGISASIRSKAARENTGQGENIFGKILMRLRAEFTGQLPAFTESANQDPLTPTSGASTINDE